MSRYVSKEVALAHPVRRTILELVKEQPGIKLTKLANQIQRKPSTVLWHTNKMNKANLLRNEKVGGARVFYLVAGGRPLRNEILAKARLANPLARHIHEVVARQPGITFEGICATVASNVSRIRWHVRRLTDAGLLCLGNEPGRAAHFYPPSALHASRAGGSNPQ
jgi:predicted transcriptional regulator